MRSTCNPVVRFIKMIFDIICHIFSFSALFNIHIWLVIEGIVRIVRIVRKPGIEYQSI
jgi:hypothetical protein